MTQGELTAAEEFEANRPRYTRLRDEVLFALNAEIKARRVKTHTVLGRVKDLESFLEKIERKGYVDPFRESEDLVGCRVVCLFLSDLSELRRIIDDLFVIVDEEDKVRGGSTDSFGYMSVHYICRLRTEHVGPRYDDLKDLKFEIQCRTILMDAWANVSHYLAYKGEASIPDELKRDFHALSGSFYVADRHFELFFAESIAARGQTISTTAALPAPGVTPAAQATDAPLNLDTMLGIFGNQYPARKRADVDAVSTFVEEAAAAGYSTVGTLRAALATGHAGAVRYERAHPPGPNGDGEFADLGLARHALAIADPDYAESQYPRLTARIAGFRESE